MAPKIMLWIPNQSIQELVKAVLIETKYNVTLVDNQSFQGDSLYLENFALFLLDMEVYLEQTDLLIPFIAKFRRLANGKVVILSKPEFYPIVQKNELQIHQLADHVLFYPIDKYELLENVKRYVIV